MQQIVRQTVLLTMVLTTCALSTKSWAQGRGRSSPVRVDAIRVETSVERRMVTGDVLAVQRANVAAREPGVVIEMHVREGQTVSKGDPLVRLDDTRLQIERSELHAEQKVAEALRDQREAQYNRAVRDEQLIRSSLERGAANPRELLDAETDVHTSHAQLAVATQQIAVIKSQAALLDQRIVDMQVTAPFAGLIVARHTEQGQWISEGDPVVELISKDTFEAWLNVPQRHLSTLQRQTSEHSMVVVKAGGTTFQARIDRLIPDVAQRGRMFKLVVLLHDKDGAIAPGMSIVAWLATGEPKLHMTVHKDAVGRNNAGTFVYAVRPGRDSDSLSAVPVQINLLYPQGERYVIEANDLKPGEEVITEGNERLFPYSAVQPVREKSVPASDGNHTQQ